MKNLCQKRGNSLLLILDSHSRIDELPPYVNGKITEAVNSLPQWLRQDLNSDLRLRVRLRLRLRLRNSIAIKFLAKVRTSVVDTLFVINFNGPERQRGMAKTIVDKDWQKTEKQIERAIRFFPDVVIEKRHGGYYPIQGMAMRCSRTMNFNLINVSLIPIVIKLAIEFRQLDEEQRGGLLSLYPDIEHDWNTLQQIICYRTKKNEDNQLLDDCFSNVRNWMRENNYLVTKDIQQYNLLGRLYTRGEGFLSESRLRYLIDMDPVSLSVPCFPENGNWLPIHWSATLLCNQEGIRIMSMLLKTGMQHYPKEFGFMFREGTHCDENGNVFRETPYRRACDKYGHGKVMTLVMDRIQDYTYCSTSTSDANNRETSLLMSAITDESIHFDCLYILVRKDPTAALSKMQQQFLRVDTNTNSNDKNTNGATDSIAAAVSVSMTTTAPTPTTVS